MLILGATGGAGLAAVEIALRFGANAVAAGTSDEKLKLCEERGAHQLLNLTGIDVKEAVRGFNGGNGRMSSSIVSAALMRSPRCGDGLGRPLSSGWLRGGRSPRSR